MYIILNVPFTKNLYIERIVLKFMDTFIFTLNGNKI
jgi:hypothetical protein